VDELLLLGRERGCGTVVRKHTSLFQMNAKTPPVAGFLLVEVNVALIIY